MLEIASTHALSPPVTLSSSTMIRTSVLMKIIPRQPLFLSAQLDQTLSCDVSLFSGYRYVVKPHSVAAMASSHALVFDLTWCFLPFLMSKLPYVQHFAGEALDNKNLSLSAVVQRDISLVLAGKNISTA